MQSGVMIKEHHASDALEMIGCSCQMESDIDVSMWVMMRQWQWQSVDANQCTDGGLVD
jgi:hypothetical protein